VNTEVSVNFKPEFPRQLTKKVGDRLKHSFVILLVVVGCPNPMRIIGFSHDYFEWPLVVRHYDPFVEECTIKIEAYTYSVSH
jgi:hypothetical protein